MFIKQNLKSCTIPKALLLPSVSRSFFSNYLFRVCSLLPRYIIVLIVLIEEDFLVSCRICVFSLLQLALWLQPSKVSFSFPGQCPIVHITKSNPCLIRLLMNIQIAWMFCCNNILKHLIIISQHVPNAKLQCNFEAEGLIIVPFTWNCSISNWMTHEWVLTFRAKWNWNIFESIFVQNPNYRIWTKKKMQAHWTKVKTTKTKKEKVWSKTKSKKKSPTQGKCWH